MKKNFFRILAVIATMAMLAIACQPVDKPVGPDDPEEQSGGEQGGEVNPPKPEVKITVAPTTAEVIAGETVTLTATTENFDGTVAWASDQPEIATVEGGVVTGVAEGTAVITATAGEKSASATITVLPVPGPTVQTVALKYDPLNCYNYTWSEATSLPAFTMEFKFMAKTWHGKNNESGICNRLAGIENISEQGVMLRFNDGACWGSNNSYAADGTFGILQICSFFTGDWVVNMSNTGSSWRPSYSYGTKFMPNVWYTLSITWDGENMTVYVDGESVATKAAASKGKGQALNFERFELGMSWWEGDGGHDADNGWPIRQLFDGYLAYARLWNAVIPASQIKENLCFVTNADNLVANWVCDTYGEHKIKDYAEGGKYSMDFSKAKDMDGSTVLNEVDCSTTFEAAWEEFEDGICPEPAEEGGEEATE